jgi:mono/diheme cytochrome c family protein
MSFRYAFIFSLFLAAAAAPREARAADPVTFNKDVVRIFQRHCQSCHRPGNIGPFSMLTYTDTRHHAFEIKRAVESRYMPPWKPVNSHGVFESERGLTDAEIQTIAQWVADGVLEGSPTDLPEAVTFPDTWSAGQPDTVVQPSAAFSVPAGSADIYRCFPITINSQSDIYVRGYEVLPGNRSIVHHVLLFIDERGQSVALDNADPGLGYTCFGGAGFLTGLGGLGGWAPGASAQMFPLGTGVRIPAGARIVMQVHYSTSDHNDAGLAGAATPIAPDLTRLGVYVSPTPLQALGFLPIVNPFFTIPAGNSRYKVEALRVITADVDLVSIAPHMHLLGREAVVEAQFPNGDRRELIRIDDWDFHWQGNYVLREPVFLPTGTLIKMTAYYDNSSNNPRNPSNPPVDVRWGERTTDEMCLTFISVKAPGTPSLNTVPFSITDRGTNSVVTQGTNAQTQVGYARVSDPSGAPQGLAIFGFRQNGVLISEAGVPASGLITRGRMYAQTGSGVRTGLAIMNPTNAVATVGFTFTDESGRDVSSGSTTVPANGQIAAFLDEQPFNGAAPFSGSLTFSASTGVAVVALRGVTNERSEFLLTTQPVTDLSATPSTAPAVFPHFANGGGWRTGIILVNPTNVTISGRLRYGNPSGSSQDSDIDYLIPGNAAVQFICCLSSLPDSVRVGTVSIIPSSGSATPTGSLVFSYTRSNIRVTEAAVPLVQAGNAFRVYVEASDAIQSGIALANTSSGTATVRLELIDPAGTSVAATSLTLSANAQLSQFLNQISGFETLKLPFRGLLRITSASPIAVTGLRSRINERGDFLITTTPPIPESSGSSASELFFPHIADAGGYTTQFILFSGGSGRSLRGNIRFMSQSGQPLDLKVR